MKKKNQMYSDDFGVNLNRALRFLSFRPRSEKEIKDYLSTKGRSSFGRKKEVSQEIIDKVIEKLKEQKFINDIEFAKWWIEQRTKVKPRASRLIKFELKQKGIAKELIDEVFEDDLSSDLEKAKVLAEKRIERYKNEDQKKIYEKLGRFLASKGFDYDTIKEVIDRILSKGYN